MNILVFHSNIFIFILNFGTIVVEKSSNTFLGTLHQGPGCTLPPQPNFGTWKISGDENKYPGDMVTTGTILLATCDINRRLITITTGVYCLPNGKWNKEFPDCIPPSPCGHRLKYDFNANEAAPLIYNGVQLNKIVYPWVAAVYRDDGRRYENICGGTIITKSVILTAAHCVADNYGNAYSADQFQIGVAKLYSGYIDTRDKRAQLLNVKEIIVYHDYGEERGHSFGDIAMMVTETLIKLSALSHPVCIKNVKGINLRPEIDVAEVAGWGKTEDDEVSDPLRTIRIPHKDQNRCMQELGPKFTRSYNLTGRICAGFHRQEKSVCVGDSGSGLVFKNAKDNLYYIHGVVSVMPQGPEMGLCNSADNTLYTKVAYFYDWIMGELRKRNDTIENL